MKMKIEQIFVHCEQTRRQDSTFETFFEISIFKKERKESVSSEAGMLLSCECIILPTDEISSVISNEPVPNLIHHSPLLRAIFRKYRDV